MNPHLGPIARLLPYGFVIGIILALWVIAHTVPGPEPWEVEAALRREQTIHDSLLTVLDSLNRERDSLSVMLRQRERSLEAIRARLSRPGKPKC